MARPQYTSEHLETAEKVFIYPLKDEKWGLLYVIHSYKDAKI